MGRAEKQVQTFLDVPFQGTFRAAEMYLWLGVKHDAFKFKGGQCSPLPANRKPGSYWGYPKEIEDA